MAAADDLLGEWSADAIYGPGAQSDEILVFKQDGTGFLECSAPVPSCAELFRWSVEAADQLRLIGYRTLDLNEDCTAVVEGESTLDMIVPFSIRKENPKAGRRMRVLRLGLRPWPGVADHFGFCSRDLTNRQQPDFSWLEKKRAGHMR